MIRLGFFLGFLLGAAAGAALSQPSSESGRPSRKPLDRLRASVNSKILEAKEAGRQEARAKEAAMMEDYENATRQPDREPV